MAKVHIAIEVKIAVRLIRAAGGCATSDQSHRVPHVDDVVAIQVSVAGWVFALITDVVAISIAGYAPGDVARIGDPVGVAVVPRSGRRVLNRSTLPGPKRRG